MSDKSNRPSSVIDTRTIVEHSLPNSPDTATEILNLLHDEGLLPKHVVKKVPAFVAASKTEEVLSARLNKLRCNIISIQALAAELQVLTDNSFTDTNVYDVQRLKTYHSDGKIASTDGTYAAIASLRALQESPIPIKRSYELLHAADSLKKFFMSCGNDAKEAEGMLQDECQAIDDGIKLWQQDKKKSVDIRVKNLTNKLTDFPDF